jgi:Flp pilus assembly protein TadB
MHFNLRQSILLLVSGVLITCLAFPSSLLAQTQVVSQAEIHKELVNNAQTRQKNLEKAKQLFSLDMGRKSGESERINAAVSKLSDAELAQMASRADKLQQDFAAGRLSDRDLLLIVLGIAALILVIVAVR